MTNPIFIRTGDVAQRLCMSKGRFLAARQRLEDEHGFPQPMPHVRRPMLWRLDQVAQWIMDHGTPRDVEDRIDPALIQQGRVRILAEARRA